MRLSSKIGLLLLVPVLILITWMTCFLKYCSNQKSLEGSLIRAAKYVYEFKCREGHWPDSYAELGESPCLQIDGGPIVYRAGGLTMSTEGSGRICIEGPFVNVLATKREPDLLYCLTLGRRGNSHAKYDMFIALTNPPNFKITYETVRRMRL